MVEITGSRWKYSVHLGIVMAFVAMGLGLWSHDVSDFHRFMLRSGVVFFGLGAVVFSWLLIRPQRLLLDDEGFTLAGGLVWSPEKVRWHDVERFFVYRVGRASKMIGYNFKPGVRQASALRKLSRALGADAGLASGWSRSTEDIVALLNDHLSRAREQG